MLETYPRRSLTVCDLETEKSERPDGSVFNETPNGKKIDKYIRLATNTTTLIKVR